MTKRYLRSLLLLFVFIFIVSCGKNQETVQPDISITHVIETTPELTPEPVDPVQELIDVMTVEEKVGQLLTVGFNGTTMNQELTTYLTEYQVGGVIFFKRNMESVDQIATLTNAIKETNSSQFPLFISVDHEGGMVDRMPSALSRTSSAYTIGQVNSPELAYQMGTVLADTCYNLGFNMDFAPCLDVWSNPNNTVIGKRAFSTDFQSVASLAPQTALGMSDSGVIPVVKHFPGHGDTLADSHYDLPVVHKTWDQLLTQELVPFTTAIQENGNSMGIMVAHILMTQLDDFYPATLSETVVTHYLRGELGFDGVVTTDDLTMGAISNSYGMGEACVLAVLAGCDQLLVCHQQSNVEDARTALLDAVSAGRISMERLDESVTRILKMKADYQLDRSPVPMPNVSAMNEVIASLSN